MNKETGVNFVHVPYKGVAPAVTDVLGGHIEVRTGLRRAPSSRIGPAAKAVVLATATICRSAPLEPEVPTFYELGYKGIDLHSWNGIFGPKGMQPATVKLLNDHLNVDLEDARCCPDDG